MLGWSFVLSGLLFFKVNGRTNAQLKQSCRQWFSVDSEVVVTAIEYGLIASLVALAIIVGATALGTHWGVQLRSDQGDTSLI